MDVGVFPVVMIPFGTATVVVFVGGLQTGSRVMLVAGSLMAATTLSVAVGFAATSRTSWC